MAKASAAPEKKDRRQYGSGSIYQRKDGKWVGRIEAGWTVTGARRRIAVVADTEPKCKAALTARIKKLDKEGAPVAGVTNRATVKTWAEVWLARTVHDKRPGSHTADAAGIRRWVVPTIGAKKLASLTPADVRAVSEAYRKAGLSTTTSGRTHSILIKMLRDAVLEGHDIHQRVLMVKAPSPAVSDRDAIELIDALAMLHAAANLPDGSRWVAGFLQGIRQGEALGLTWNRVDLDNGLIDISQQLQPIPYVHGCNPPCGKKTAGGCPDRRLRVPDGYKYTQLHGSMCLVMPKTDKGRRIIPLVPWMVTALRAWKENAPASPHGLVWPQPNGTPQRAGYDTAAFYALQDTAKVARVEDGKGRRYHVHEMRHTCASLLQESGVDDPTITRILGHSNILASRAYIHIGQAATRAAMAEVAARLQIG